ncbi:MAG: hypothetical protein AB7O97_16470 [Planctomycetota bacterium]
MSALDDWRRGDVRLGLLLLAVGGGVLAFAYQAMGDGTSPRLWVAAWAFGPYLVLLGLNNLVRALVAHGDRTDGGEGR